MVPDWALYLVCFFAGVAITFVWLGYKYEKLIQDEYIRKKDWGLK
jgi:hypothetical protein